MNFQKDAQCKKCKFFFAIFQPSELAKNEMKLVGGQCRIRAPQVGFVLIPKITEGTVASGGQPNVKPVIERCSAPPHVMPDFWCGEFQPVVL